MPVETSPDPESLAEETTAVDGPTPVKGGVDAAGATATAAELEQVLSSAETQQKKSNVWKILLVCLLALVLLCCCICIASYLMYGGWSGFLS